MSEPQTHAGVPDGWVVVSAQTPPAAPPGPRGSERTRPDTSIIGVDHEKLQQSIANWASTLSPQWQKPAAMLATFPADVLASLAEMFSAPESVAGAAAPKAVPAITAAAEGVGAARQALAKPADLALEALVKRSGLDPDAINLATTRLRLQAARSRTRQGRLTAEQPPTATASGASPSAVPAGAPAPPAPAGAAAPAATAAPPDVGKILKALIDEGLTKDELNEALRLIKQKVDSKTIWERIQATRKLQGKGAFAKLPSSAEVATAVKTRNESGRWPE